MTATTGTKLQAAAGCQTDTTRASTTFRGNGTDRQGLGHSHEALDAPVQTDMVRVVSGLCCSACRSQLQRAPQTRQATTTPPM